MTQQPPDRSPDQSPDQTPDVLAAEYVLGTLDADERAQVEALLESDPAFARMVKDWERRLGELHAMVDAVEPPPESWQRIRFRLGAGDRREPLRLPELPPRAAAPAEVIELRRRIDRWRAVAAGVSALAAVLAGVVVVAALGLLPLGGSAPRPADIARPAEPKPAEPAAESRFVAVLQRDAASPAFIVTVDVATRSLTVRRVAAEAESGKSYELWLVSDRFPAPRSLGLVGTQDFTAGRVLTGFDPDTISNATYAVSLEPEGGSPTGQPTGPVLFAGKLIQATQ